MGVLLQDRLSAILFHIEQWRETDPNLEYLEGFLNYLTICDIEQLKVGDTRVWKSYLNEAMKKGVTIAELLFNKQRRIIRLQAE
jgi:hypothetical protein